MPVRKCTAFVAILAEDSWLPVYAIVNLSVDLSEVSYSAYQFKLDATLARSFWIYCIFYYKSAETH